MVTDELSSGPERSGRGWLIAVLVCVAVLALVTLLTPTGGHAKTAKPTPSSSVPGLTVPTGSYEVTKPPPSSQPPSTGAPIGDLEAPPSESPAFVESSLDGIASRAVPAGVRLLLGGEHPTELGGNAKQFSQVPIQAHQAVAGIVPVKDGFVVEVENEAVKGDSALAVYWVRPNGTTSLVTNTDVAILAQSGDRIYAYRTGPGDSAPLAKRIGHLVEVTLTGHVLANHTLAAGLMPLADSPAGLVFSDLARDKIEIRDRQTMAVLKDVAKAETNVHVDRGWLVSSDDPFCTVNCVLTVENLATTKTYQVAIADQLYVGEVAVNPNGRSVAISYWGAEAPGSVVVADLASGASEEIPGIVTESRRIADIAWTPDGRTLAIAVSYTQNDVRRIALWPPDGALRVLAGTHPGASKPWSLAAF